MNALRAFLLVLWSVAAQAAPVVTDDRGASLRFDRPPERVVAMLPSLTEITCALGECGRLVGTDRYSNWPEPVRALPKLGGLDDAQIERIVALKPDVVLAARSERLIARLESLGVPVLVLVPDDLAGSARVIGVLGTLFGRDAAARELQRSIDARIAAAATRVPAAWRGAKAYFEVASTPHAAGEASFIGQLLARLALVNIVPASMGPFPQLSAEFVVRSRPDLVLVSAREAPALRRRPGWNGIPALASGQVCAFDEARMDLLVRPGPRLADGAEAIADCLAALPAR